MSNASLKEQLQAVASQLSDNLSSKLSDNSDKSERHKEQKPKKQLSPADRTKPKPKWLDYVQYGVELLKVYFPSSFKSASEVKPLKKGIKQDLVKHLSTMENIVTEDKACMVKSLSYYVNTNAYHKSVIEGAMRIDLEGKSAGHVSAEEARYSAERHQAKLQAKQSGASQINPKENIIPSHE